MIFLKVYKPELPGNGLSQGETVPGEHEQSVVGE